MAESEFVEVLDIEVKSPTGLVEHFTVRAHEGDALEDTTSGSFQIKFGAKDVFVGNEKRKVAGRVVTIARAHIFKLETAIRLEPKVRPSAKALVDKHAADLEAAQRLMEEKLKQHAS